MGRQNFKHIQLDRRANNREHNINIVIGIVCIVTFMNRLYVFNAVGSKVPVYNITGDISCLTCQSVTN